MIDFLKRLFGKGSVPEPSPPPAPTPQPAQPEEADLQPLPQNLADEFLDWYRAQRKPAVRFTPDPDAPIEPRGSRLFGSAFLPDGEDWPRDADGKPLEFLAQFDFAQCSALDGYPSEGLVQFFIGFDDVFGADFDNPTGGKCLVRVISPDVTGRAEACPPVEKFRSPYPPHFEYLESPSQSDAVRERGIALIPEPYEDQIDLSNAEADRRFFGLSETHDLDSLYEAVEAIDLNRPICHHTGGYPAFTQSDFRHDERFADFDHVLLRITSDDIIMWGDSGECVFMMRSADLARGDFSEVVYWWDCC